MKSCYADQYGPDFTVQSSGSRCTEKRKPFTSEIIRPGIISSITDSTFLTGGERTEGSDFGFEWGTSIESNGVIFTRQIVRDSKDTRGKE